MESASNFVLVCILAVGAGFLLQVIANLVLWVLNRFN